VLVVKKGRCLIDVYNDDRELVATRDLPAGHVLAREDAAIKFYSATNFTNWHENGEQN
jgi:hypothetical protein